MRVRNERETESYLEIEMALMLYVVKINLVRFYTLSVSLWPVVQFKLHSAGLWVL